MRAAAEVAPMALSGQNTIGAAAEPFRAVEAAIVAGLRAAGFVPEVDASSTFTAWRVVSEGACDVGRVLLLPAHEAPGRALLGGAS